MKPSLLRGLLLQILKWRAPGGAPRLHPFSLLSSTKRLINLGSPTSTHQDGVKHADLSLRETPGKEIEGEPQKAGRVVRSHAALIQGEGGREKVGKSLDPRQVSGGFGKATGESLSHSGPRKGPHGPAMGSALGPLAHPSLVGSNPRGV